MATQAVLKCCSTGHAWPRKPIADDRIIGAVRASIAYCDARTEAPYIRASLDCRLTHCEIHTLGKSYGKRFAAAADKLRDFATVELMCEGLGITRKDLS